MNIIDFRLRPPYGGFLNANFKRVEIIARFTNQLGFEQAESVKKLSMDLLFKEMEQAGITKGVVVGRNTAQIGAVPNTSVAEIAKTFPDKFVAVASVDPTTRKDSMLQIEEARTLGMNMINMEPGLSAEPKYFDDRRLYPIYAYCEDKNVPVILMGGGNTGPDISYSSPEHIDRVLNDFPELKVISAHGNWPWAKEIIHVAFRRANLYISPDMYLHHLPGMDDYVKAANSFLSERFLFGTAYPLTPIVEYTKWFQSLPIKTEAMENILYRNAERLLANKPRW
ncbi:amidohydrolase family protein [Bosea sp. (in: a-proteobacteria)]|uniref:amidohydrolase family protein n=1 Tax=Bosea sp. (in: a-proteobacteria) TaxID=1871050 RepID=UPI002605F9ED|nr:amidohydrolase family protein [Bosea sp. (in: a-proteobacteria)]MCO5091266.1 amidohydrolase family protein [Bosea sp. (in: a-proteobacteria)]